MSGPSFTGPAIFAGVGQGVKDGIALALQYKHLQAQDNYYKHRFVVQGVNDFYQRGGHLNALNDGQKDAGHTALPEMDFDPAAVEAANPTAAPVAEPTPAVASQGVMRLGE